MERSKLVSCVGAMTLILAACADAAPSQVSVGDGVVAELAGSLSPEEAAAAAEGVNAFGFDLHGAVAEPGQNTVTSPLSASVLLAMVAAGGGGETAKEMVEVLRLEEARDTRYAALLADLTDASDVTLSVANSLWAAEGYPFEDDYIDFVQDTFGATLDEVDLGEQQSADRIDDWVEDRTEGLIEEIAEDLDLPNPQAVLVLLNAVYFLGTWTTTFDEAETRDAPFTLADGSKVEVPTMYRSDPEVETAGGEGFTMFRLPYGDDERFGMEVLLPDEGMVLDDLLGQLDADTWQGTVDQLASSTPSQLALPRFELEWDATLNDALQDLGIVSAFGGGDFTPMSPANPWLDTVVQKTYIRVDEEGTEAAAVTGGVMRESEGPPPLLVDRPFAFTVSDRDTGTILFLGTVHDPRS
ncbi:MAG: serpin family protein [Nitriliruptor sp.]|uniref:serpin family protein n=1 Tax=Nitriliruptor sp. TaxID=2448056 RepID=UPI00349FE3A7